MYKKVYSFKADMNALPRIWVFFHFVYVYYVELTMVASNANNNRPTINYSRLLTKLKAELPETSPKKPRNTKKFYSTEAQRRLLDVCGYKISLNPPDFESVWEVNQFVTKHTEHRKDFEKMYGGLPCPGMQLMCHIHSLFRTLLHHALYIF